MYNYAEDIERQAREMGAAVAWDQDDVMRAWANMETRTLHAKRPTNRVAYYVAMHELGHLATTPTYRPESQAEEVMWEARATAWAFEHGAWPVTSEVRKVVLDTALLSYVRSGYTLPKDEPAYRSLVAATPARRALFEEEARKAAETDAYARLRFNRMWDALFG